MAVALPLSIQEFNGSVQIKFKQSVARAAGVSSAEVTIDRILDMSGGDALRRLLATGIRVETSVQASNANAASGISASLSADSLNAALVAAGLPAATILEAPTFAPDREMTTFASDRQMTTTPVPTPAVIPGATSEAGTNLAAIIGGTVGGLSVFGFFIFARMYHIFGR
jgi:hypothetical protein